MPTEPATHRTVFEQLGAITHTIFDCQNYINAVRLATDLQRRVVLSEDNRVIIDDCLEMCLDLPHKVSDLFTDAFEGKSLEDIKLQAIMLQMVADRGRIFMKEMKEEYNV